MEFIEEKIFPDILLGCKLNLDTQILKEECYKLKSQSNGRNISNKGGWQSLDLNPTELKNLNLLNLANVGLEINKALNNYLKKNNLPKAFITNIWVNINPPSSYNLRHTHPGSIFSGTYYIKVPKNSNSHLTFWRDRSFTDCNMGLLKTKSSLIPKPEYRSNHNITPTEDSVIFFPSYLEHSVEENISLEDRISISFNTFIKS